MYICIYYWWVVGAVSLNYIIATFELFKFNLYNEGFLFNQLLFIRNRTKKNINLVPDLLIGEDIRSFTNIRIMNMNEPFEARS